MLATWILGGLFFLFIIAFLAYVIRVRVADAGGSGVRAVSDLPAGSGARSRISREMLVLLDAHAYVNYPFGIRVLFPLGGQATPLGGSTGPARPFQESDYHRWPARQDADPQLVAHTERIELGSADAEPALWVVLRFDRSAFDAVQAKAMARLEVGRETAVQLWLNPLVEGSFRLTVVIGRETAGSEVLIELPVEIAVAQFPIRLR